MKLTTKRMARLGVALLVAACGSSSDDAASGPPAPSATTAPGEAPPGTTPASPPGTTPPSLPGALCTGKGELTGDLAWKLDSGGLERTLHVHVPKGYDRAKPAPVVLNFHGLGSNARQQAIVSGMNDKSEKETFIAVHPEGTGASQSWNAGACCGTAASSAVDDIAFVGKMIDELESRLCVDSRRVFATGMSNGGFVSHRLACELSGRIAAVAPVAGVLAIPTCNPTRPMSVFQFHGTLDGLVPYAGNPSMGFPSVMQTLASWAGRNGCSVTPRETSKRGEVTCVTFDGCKDGAEVNLCTAEGGGHTWPGGLPVPALGRTTSDIVATDAMWDFFVKHPLP